MPEDDNAPGASNVGIFVRVRPVQRASKNVAVSPEDGKLHFHIPRDEADGYINNQREDYKFLFNGVLTSDSKQAEVFERVCRPAVETFLSGINSTIFAYGQTGSGKTFTITGGPERYEDRGLIPRSISHLFHAFKALTDASNAVHVSYMELYNGQAYDLLDPSREIAEMADLPRVTILEDDEGRYHMRGLSLHPAASEEDALNLLFLGDTNRMIAETPMNLASSRSHCVFSLHLEARRAGEAVVRRSKLNLVDLAGSERVAKSGIGGAALGEAKYINASLHYLEQVIMALQERAMGIPRPHIPYRNSLMTMVLRDSLGGNCRTTMVANVNLSPPFVDESISTCRFAQRVAMVANRATVNEETDPRLVIAKLKQEVRDLQAEVALLKGEEEPRGPLTEGERERLEAAVRAYVDDRDPDAALPLRPSMLEMRAALAAFKAVCLERGAAVATGAPEAAPAAAAPNKGVGALQDEAARLRLQVQQRDTEIAILVNMLKKRGPPGMQAAAAAPTPPPAEAAAPVPPGAALLDVSVLRDRNQAFEVFRKSYHRNAAIEGNKATLKEKYARAKALGAHASGLKTQLAAAKADLEQRRLRSAAADISAGGDGVATGAPDAGEQAALRELERLRGEYTTAFDELRTLKGEIEHVQRLLEQSRARIAKDFERWYTTLLKQSSAGGAPASDPAHVASSVASLDVRTSAASPAPSSVACSERPGAAATANLGPSAKPDVPLGGCGLMPAAGPAGRLGSATCDIPSQASDSGALRSGGSAIAKAGTAVPPAPRYPAAVHEAAAPLLTGDAAADADILAFYAARHKIVGGAAHT